MFTQRHPWIHALVLIWGVIGAAMGAHAQEAPSVEAQRVSNTAFYVQGLSALGSATNQNYISNAGFVITQTGVVVIDALGSPALADKLVQQIRKLTPLPISHVILTHYHADHIYGLQALKAQGAKVVAHRAALSYLNSETAEQRLAASRHEFAPWINNDTRLVRADEWLDGDRELRIGGVTFMVKAVGPAHTPEDLVVYLPAEKVLFAGDLVFRNRIPFVGQANSQLWMQAIQTLLAFDTVAIVPGHGPVSVKAKQDMQQTYDYLAYLRKAMGDAALNLDPFEEAYRTTDWSSFDQIPLFQFANRMNAYNTYLLMEQELKK